MEKLSEFLNYPSYAMLGAFLLGLVFTGGILFLLWAGKIDIKLLGEFLKITPKS
jgi:membrane protein CcdC involved in cytochrome C biogenesis